MGALTISGKAGSGKDTVGRLVAEQLGVPVVGMTFKELAKERGISLMEFQKLAEKDPEIDREFDRKLAQKAIGKDCVVTTWLGPWIVTDASFRAYLDASEEVRAKRLAGRDGVSEKDALAHLRERDKENRERYSKLYGIDIWDRKIFDIVIGTSEKAPEQIAREIVAAFRKKSKK